MSMSHAASAAPTSERRSARREPEPASLTKKALTATCLIVTIALLVPAGEMLMAGLSSYRVELALQRWSNRAEPPPEAQWRSALQAAQRANAAYPVAKGTYLDQLGRVHAWHEPLRPAGDPAERETRLAALSALRLAVAARPTWPDSWAQLAHSKYTLGEFDDEFAHALEQANHWGPHRPGVQFELANIALRAWPNLSPTQRLTAFTSLRRAIDGGNNAASTLFALAQSRGLETVFCTNAAYDIDRVRKLCKRGGTTK